MTRQNLTQSIDLCNSATEFEVMKTVKTPAVLSPLIRSLFRLWCHENTRTYCDRLFDEDQRFWFASVLNEQIEEHFCKGEGSLELMLEKYNSQKIVEGKMTPWEREILFFFLLFWWSEKIWS